MWDVSASEPFTQRTSVMVTVFLHDRRQHLGSISAFMRVAAPLLGTTVGDMRIVNHPRPSPLVLPPHRPCIDLGRVALPTKDTLDYQPAIRAKEIWCGILCKYLSLPRQP